MMLTRPLAAAHPVPVLAALDGPALQRRFKALLAQMGCVDRLVFAGSLAQARACLAGLCPRLALVDPRLPDGCGLDLVREIRAAHGQAGILVVSAGQVRAEVAGALQAGATGYMLRERDDVELMLAIHNVLRGGMVIDPFVMRQILPQAVDCKPKTTPALAQKAQAAMKTRATRPRAAAAATA
jgi:DNA-binding NarL/FixJ family response regulator